MTENELTPVELETMYNLLEKFERQLQRELDIHDATHEYSTFDSTRYSYEYRLAGVRRIIEDA